MRDEMSQEEYWQAEGLVDFGEPDPVIVFYFVVPRLSWWRRALMRLARRGL